MRISKIFLVFICVKTYVQSAPRHPRLSLAENAPSYFYSNMDGDKAVYTFGYDVSDPETGNIQFRAEERYPNGTVAGNYGYVDALGTPLRYRYMADENGYRVFQELPSKPNQPLVDTINSQEESSVTWSRPKRPNKKKTQNSLLSKLGYQRRNYNIVNLEHGAALPFYYTY